MNWIVQLIVTIVLSIAATIVESIGKQDQKQKVAGVRGTLQTGGDHPLAFIMGLYATGGHLEYAGTWGNDGDTPNAYYSKVISVSDLPIRGFRRFAVNGKWVTLAATKTSNLGYAVLEYRVKGKDHLWINPYSGTQTAQDPLMGAKFGGDSARPYQNMIGRGIAYFVATALVNRELFSGLPDYLAEVDGIPLDDPRDGAASHENPIVGVDNILTGLSYDGIWLYGPQSISPARRPLANWSPEMDKCDALRTVVGGGTEKRFRFGLEVLVDQEPQAIIGEILKACEGRIAEIGGIYKVLVGEPGDPVKAFTDEDIVITEGQVLNPFPGLEATYNGMTATYPEPAEAWQNKEAPARYRSDLEALDDGRRLPFSTEYKAVPFPVQVQELMRAAIEETRRFRKPTFTAPPEWWEYEPLDPVAWSSARNGFENKSFLITVISDLPNGNQVVGLQEIDPADYGWSSDYELPWDTAPLVIARPAPQLMSGWQALPAVLVDNTDASRRPSIEVRFDAGLADVRAVQVQVRLAGETGLAFDGEVPYDPDELSPARTLNGVFLPDTDYEVRGRYVPFSGRVTRWSNENEDGTEGAWLAVTTPDIRFGPSDFYPIDTTGLAEQVTDFFRWTAQSNAKNRDDIQSVVVRLQDQADTSLDTFQQIRQSLTATAGDLRADYNNVVTTAVGEVDGKLVAVTTRVETLEAAYSDPVTGNDALASGLDAISTTVTVQGDLITANSTAITSVQASVDDVSAGGAARFEAAASPGGGYSRYGVAVFANGTAGYVQAGFYFDVNGTTGDSRGVLAADEIVVAAPDGSILALFDTSGSTAYIDNARIHNLTADNIDVEALTASSAFIANLQVDWANITNISIDSADIGTATIERLNLKDGSVSDWVSNSGDGPDTQPSGTSLTFNGDTWVAPSFPILGAGSASLGGGSTVGETSNCRIELYDVTAGAVAKLLASGARSVNAAFVMGPLTGGHTYRLRATVSHSNDQNSFWNAGPWALQVVIPRK